MIFFLSTRDQMTGKLKTIGYRTTLNIERNQYRKKAPAQHDKIINSK